MLDVYNELCIALPTTITLDSTRPERPRAITDRTRCAANPMVAHDGSLATGRLLSSTLVAATACFTLYSFFWPALRPRLSPKTVAALRTRTTAHTQQEEGRRQLITGQEDLPYPPDAFPGARDVETPYGTIKVFEWGPETGDKVLLLHGIGTPCIALGDMASELVRNGCRVMLFDFFGRGYSDAPLDVPYDNRLYTSQILLALASSPLPWAGSDAFHLLGYSLGGAIAASFAAYHAHLLRSLTLVCPGGLIRPSHLGWRSRLLYSQGLLPESLLMWLARRRLEPSVGRGPHVPDEEDADLDFDDVPISTLRKTVKVGHVVGWQLAANPGFVTAYMSTIRNAPIYSQHDKVWKLLGDQLRARHPLSHDSGAAVAQGLPNGRICLILAERDPIVVKEEWIEDSRNVLGPDAVIVHVVKGGHEIAISKGREVAQLAMRSWNDNRT
ncbi:LOW QUALITY PROTEIN: Serine hydrolase-like protein [Paramyrothecium foliicola]|nr:LOW QUALITY PROTEIN: Serine hydrolase-like protein [Paramyrothecium foliicola]